MSKTLRPWDIEQRWLLPPSVHELVPAGHVAHFVRDTVRENLVLGAILSDYSEERGQPSYHPTMMVALLLYAYSRGVYSSRGSHRPARSGWISLAVTAMNQPDFRTIAKFRQRHLKAPSDLFVQVLKLCRAAGLVKLGHVALDGTKVHAHASVHKAMSYGRMLETEKRLAADVSPWFASAEATDAEEDRVHGSDRRGNEMPDWVANRTARLDRIRAAKASLEAEAKKPPPDDDGPGPSSGMIKSGKPDRGPDGGPPDRAQRNFTDPDSRIQPLRCSWFRSSGAKMPGRRRNFPQLARAVRPCGGRNLDKARSAYGKAPPVEPGTDRRCKFSTIHRLAAVAGGVTYVQYHDVPQGTDAQGQASGVRSREVAGESTVGRNEPA
jgi:transposase